MRRTGRSCAGGCPRGNVCTGHRSAGCHAGPADCNRTSADGDLGTADGTPVPPTEAPTVAPTTAPTEAAETPTAAPPAGAAPAIPHPIAGMEGQCLTCHGEGGQKPVPADHAGRTADTCTTCHQPGEVTAGPKIPHPIAGMEGQCLTCHGPGGQKPVPADHAGRTVDTCTTCHQAGDDQPDGGNAGPRFPIPSPGWRGSALPVMDRAGRSRSPRTMPAVRSTPARRATSQRARQRSCKTDLTQNRTLRMTSGAFRS